MMVTLEESQALLELVLDEYGMPFVDFADACALKDPEHGENWIYKMFSGEQDPTDAAIGDVCQILDPVTHDPSGFMRLHDKFREKYEELTGRHLPV